MDAAPAKRLTVRPEWRGNRLSFVAAITPTLGSSAAPSPSDSPLTQQARPDVFEPKIVGLHRRLFEENDDEDLTDTFWHTLFLLKPDIRALRELLNSTDAGFLLNHQHRPQQLLTEAIACIKEGQAPSDENALDTLTVFFAVLLTKKFVNSSSDLIEVLAGLDNIDAVFSELVTALDNVIKNGRTVDVRRKAVRATIAIVSGGYQTALVSYFIHRDLFPALMKLLHQMDNALQAAEPLLLTGLLANYNKFEVHNQYRVRFSDFVNEETMVQVVRSISWTTTLLRECYVAIQDDTPAGWASSIGTTLSYVGLGSISTTKTTAPVLTEEQGKELFAEQPSHEAATLLTLYDFVLANKLFCQHLICTPAEDKGQAPPFGNFLSFASYLFQHAYRNARAASYAYLVLLIILVLIEDPVMIKLLLETSSTVRLCRQRPPFLPLPKGQRPFVSAIFDILIDGINHNLRKKLDTKFYTQSITVLTRILTFFTKTRSKLYYHWSELWRSLLSFTRFLTTYADDLRGLLGTEELVQSVITLLMLSLTSGESFVPDAAAYDDLFYKLIESGDALVKFREAYKISKADVNSPINTLIGVSKHYQELIESQKSKGTHLSPREIGKIIKQGYETLSIEITEGLDEIETFREADHKVELKKIARVVVADAALLGS